MTTKKTMKGNYTMLSQKQKEFVDYATKKFNQSKL